MAQRPSTHYAFSTTGISIATLLFIILFLPFLLYLIIIGYSYSVIYILKNFLLVTDPRQIMSILYLIPAIIMVSISMIMAYNGHI